MKCSVIWAIFFFLSWCVCYLKGRSLRCSPGRGNAGGCAVTLYIWEGPIGSNGACFTLLRISILHSDTHNQTGPLWCWPLSGWARAPSRPLWVSQRPLPRGWESPPHPAAAPTSTGALNQRFEASPPRAGALGCAVCFALRRLSGLSVLKCGAMGCYPLLCLPRSLPL